MRKLLVVSILLVIVACTPAKQTTVQDILSEFTAQDAQYHTDWLHDTWSTKASTRELDALLAVLQNRTDELSAKNQTMLALLVASRGQMIKAQIAYDRAEGYGPKARATVPELTSATNFTQGLNSTVDCHLTALYNKAGSTYAEALSNAQKSFGALNEFLRLGTSFDAQLIGLPEFYKLDFKATQHIVDENKKAVQVCKFGGI